jgi:methionyl-tRNA formyltransferase
MNILYMGTPDFAVLPLQKLHAAGHHIVAVYTQPPRPKGRGQVVQKSPVHLCAQGLGVPVYHPLSFKKDPVAVAEFQTLCRDQAVDVAIVAAYGLILPAAVLEAPGQGCLNIHASLLPRWRGASPIQHAIWHGDAQSGVTLMRMELGLDTGPMLMTRSIDLGPDMTASALHDALSIMGAEMVVDLLTRPIPAGTVQDESCATYAPMLKKDDGRVDWRKSAVEIDRQIRALTPWPGVWCMTADGKRLKIIAAQINDVKGVPGRILSRAGDVACGAGGLRLITIHPENAKPMGAEAAFNGGYLKIDTVLE